MIPIGLECEGLIDAIAGPWRRGVTRCIVIRRTPGPSEISRRVAAPETILGFWGCTRDVEPRAIADGRAVVREITRVGSKIETVVLAITNHAIDRPRRAAGDVIARPQPRASIRDVLD